MLESMLEGIHRIRILDDEGANVIGILFGSTFPLSL